MTYLLPFSIFLKELLFTLYTFVLLLAHTTTLINLALGSSTLPKQIFTLMNSKLPKPRTHIFQYSLTLGSIWHHGPLSLSLHTTPLTFMTTSLVFLLLFQLLLIILFCRLTLAIQPLNSGSFSGLCLTLSALLTLTHTCWFQGDLKLSPLLANSMSPKTHYLNTLCLVVSLKYSISECPKQNS